LEKSGANYNYRNNPVSSVTLVLFGSCFEHIRDDKLVLLLLNITTFSITCLHNFIVMDGKELAMNKAPFLY